MTKEERKNGRTFSRKKVHEENSKTLPTSQSQKKKKGFQDHSFLPPPFLCRQAVTTEAQETTPTFPSHRNFCLYDRERLVTLSSRNERQALLFLVVGTELRRKRSQLFQNLGVQSSKAPKLSKTKLDANENGGERERERERERGRRRREREDLPSHSPMTLPLHWFSGALSTTRDQKNYSVCLSVFFFNAFSTLYHVVTPQYFQGKTKVGFQ